MKKELNVAFRLNGGIGTYIYELNFIYYFWGKYKCHIDIFASNNDELNYGLAAGQEFIENIYPRSKFTKDYKYALIIDLNWFPNIQYVDYKRITDVSLIQILNKWQDFYDNESYNNFFRNDDMYEYSIYQYCIAKEKNRMDVSDIGDDFSIEKDYFKYKLKTTLNEEKILCNFNLYDDEYVTFQYGVNQNTSSGYSPKMWIPEQIKNFFKAYKDLNKNVKIVQLGESHEDYFLDVVDVCLVNKTSFEELKILLKHAKYHLDGECGMVHMRNSLCNKPSIVLFGQTPLQIYAHKSDINLENNNCNIGCSKLFTGWKKRCLLGDEKPRCMANITADMVLERIKRYEVGACDSFNILKTKNKLDEIISNPNISIDKEWANDWLKKQHIYDYFVEEISVGELLFAKITEDGLELHHLNKSPAYIYFAGDENMYSKYMQTCFKVNKKNEHSVEKIKKLKESLDKDFDSSKMIVVDGMNCILDGAHRASYLLNKYGKDYKVNILKIYCRNFGGARSFIKF